MGSLLGCQGIEISVLPLLLVLFGSASFVDAFSLQPSFVAKLGKTCSNRIGPHILHLHSDSVDPYTQRRTIWNRNHPPEPEVLSLDDFDESSRFTTDRASWASIHPPRFDASPEPTTEQHDVPKQTPKRTPNGGYAHTEESREKISVANKGKVPWNKGKQRSEEAKARISAGVRAANRRRLEAQLRRQGTTLEEYQAKQARKEQERRAALEARKTPNGGYRLSEEAKAKISNKLKARYARGDIQRRPMDPSKVRRGFTQSDETRAKISASLRRRWAEDPAMRDRLDMGHETHPMQRHTISEALKQQLKDPAYKARMVEKLNLPKALCKPEKPSASEVMKAKWQDPEFRNKILRAMEGRSSTGVERPPGQRKRSKRRRSKSGDWGDSSEKASNYVHEPPGSLNRLRAERRDLFELLYGEDEDVVDEHEPTDGWNADSELTSVALGDDDLDSFDPYGLDDY